MKKLLLLSLAAMLHLGALAQKHIYEDLLVLYVDEKYDKCIFKAEGYTTNDKTKRDALPFLYISMCYHEMSKQEKYLADNPKASRDALKWAEKYRRKDKDLEFFHNYEDYWMSLNTAAMDEGENLMDDPKGMSRARQIWSSMTKYYPENPGPWLMLAIAQYNSNLARDAELTMKEFDKAFKAAGNISTLPADQQKLLKSALIRYSDYAMEKGLRDKARSYIALGKDYFMGEADFKSAYNNLH
jgi:hypothetical protein